MLQFPVVTMIRFCHNHGLIQITSQPGGPAPAHQASGVCLHYLLNLLQPLSFTQPVVVSLNPVRDIARKPIMGEYDYPTYFLMLPMRSLHRHGSGALAHNRRGLLSFHDRAALHLLAAVLPNFLARQAGHISILAGWRKGLFDIHFPKRFTHWMKALRLLPYGLYFAVVRKFTAL
jgi:hypothetical protein